MENQEVSHNDNFDNEIQFIDEELLKKIALFLNEVESFLSKRLHVGCVFSKWPSF